MCVCVFIHSLDPLDVPLVAFIATKDRILHIEYDADVSSGHVNWQLRQDKTLDIPNATALDVDVMENMIYWINLNDKVGTTNFCMYMYGDYV